MHLLATASRGTADLVADDCRRLGLHVVDVRRDGVILRCEPEDAARALVHMRIATRLLLPLADIDCPNADALYASLSKLYWADWLDDRHTIAVYCSGVLPGAEGAGRKRAGVGNGLATPIAASMRAKEAICDRLRRRYGGRPSVDLDDPDVHIHIRFNGDRATVALDLCGQPLHLRGYRVAEAEDAVRENVAAAMAMASGWDGSRPLLDPLCGSGTLLIEAVSNALRLAPGARRDFAVERWPWHGDVMGKLLDQERAAAIAHEQRALASANKLDVLGLDFDRGAVRTATIQIRRAGMSDVIRVDRGEARAVEAPGGTVVLTNPPVASAPGGRDVEQLYRELGAHWSGFDRVDAFVVDGHPGFVAAFGLPSTGCVTFANGKQPLQLRHYRLRGERRHFEAASPPSSPAPTGDDQASAAPPETAAVATGD